MTNTGERGSDANGGYYTDEGGYENDLTEFQKDILHVLVGDPMHGLRIKEELEDRYDKEINHGRLYPNLDKLNDEDYVEKHSRDDRTNEYEVTHDGLERILYDMEWRVGEFVDGNMSRAEQVEKMLERALSW
ncbi:MAG: PadR family transcriptional regulator [Halobacteria archaeon]|nr:PadR family transcriptional regulator [Halobacteria archaeon]